jgi:NADP-dependent 3-hydroxy acid dehydrogenase YdfG
MMLLDDPRFIYQEICTKPKSVLVTGALSGIGEETARSLLAAGYIVYAGARRVTGCNSWRMPVRACWP